MSSVVFFFIGYVFAPTAYYKKIKWLTAYPLFIITLIDKYFNKNWHPVKIFLVLVILNTSSLYVNLLSGYTIILPYIMAIYLGLNIGIIMYHTLEGRFFYISLMNPVAILELPASWLSLTMAIQISLNKILNTSNIPDISFNQYSKYFLMTIIPLLITAGIIETILIIIARKHEKNKEE
jgi:uncharacterized membrane protein SpoIIM required for sporulation